MGDLIHAIHIGADIGQQRDPTALAAVEVTMRPTGRHLWYDQEYHQLFGRCSAQCVEETEAVYGTRRLERLPLGTPYSDVAERIYTMVRNLRALQPNVAIKLYADQTGVGRPVIELAAAKVRGICVVIPVTFVAGERFTYDPQTGEARLGKGFLVSRLQVLLQGKRAILPQTDEGRALKRELETYEIKVDAESAHATFGAFRTGAHDDLATALGLAVVEGPRMSSVVGAFAQGNLIRIGGSNP